MTHAAALVGLFYNAVDLQQDDLQWFFEIERGLDEVPSVRGRDSIVPAADGRTERNRKNDIISIVLKGWVRADPTVTDIDDARASYRANMATIRALFHPRNPRADLTAVLEDGTIQTISARGMNIVGGRSIGSEYRDLSIELEGYDDWQEVAGS